MKIKIVKKIIAINIIFNIILSFPFYCDWYGAVYSFDLDMSEYVGDFFVNFLNSFITMVDSVITGEDYGTIEYDLYEFEEEEEIEDEGEIEDDIGVNDAEVAEMLKSCKKIATYMKENSFRYGFRWSISYKETKQACCASYVSWVLLDRGLISEKQFNTSVLGDGNVGRVPQSRGLTFKPKHGLWSVLDNDSRWERRIAINDSDIKPGDIQIYESNGSGHINICAENINGHPRYWDAGNGKKGAFKGTTKTYNRITIKKTGYTCSYRLKTSK